MSRFLFEFGNNTPQSLTQDRAEDQGVEFPDLCCFDNHPYIQAGQLASMRILNVT